MKKQYRKSSKKPSHPKQAAFSPEETLYQALYAAYGHHCDSQHNEPDKIADVAIVDKALEENGLDIPFSDAMSYYRQMKGQFYREYHAYGMEKQGKESPHSFTRGHQ